MSDQNGGLGGCGYENLTLTIIEQVKEKNKKEKRLKEKYNGSTNSGSILKMVTGTTAEKKNLENECSYFYWLKW